MPSIKNVVILLIAIVLFSCAPKTTKEQNEQYESCKKMLIDHKGNYLQLTNSPQVKDSLQHFLKDIEQCDLDQLISKYEVEPEHVDLLIFSVCQKAELAKPDHSMEDALIQTDKAIRTLDSIMREDSLRKSKK